MTDALRLEAFSYRHPASDTAALRDVDLTVEDGEFVVIAGASGAGKSTLLRAACGLAPAFDGGTAAGRVVTGGLDTREHGPGEVARVCGTVLQDAERQVIMGRVRAELALPLESRGLSASEVARGVEETALLVGLEGLLDRNLTDLSGGELQRVATAAALACRPRLLLLDEPTSQLDPVAADDLIWLLRRLNEEQGVAVVIAEQRLERLLPAADRVVVLDSGRVVLDSTPHGFLDWSVVAAPELQTPAAAMFAAAGITEPPVSVKDARRALAEHGRTVSGNVQASGRGERRRGSKEAVRVRGLWDERHGGKALLAGVDLVVSAGETVALMGRNGAGKSTLLRHVAGLIEPTRGKVRCVGEVAMLAQNPADQLICERIGDIASPAVLEAAGIPPDGDRNPRDLSGGERQRLAFEVVVGAADGCAAVLLDEPTRGLDRGRRADLAGRIRTISERGAAVLLATHDAELAAEVADRVVLLADGMVLADGDPREILTGGWYFTTETSRILGGSSRALLPAEGAALLSRDEVGDAR